jgi:phosphoglycolate phosphatase
MLILFDVDATLISTSGAGIRAMAQAGQALYGTGFTIEGVEFAGRLDPLIITDMLRANGRPLTPEACRAFRDGYLRFLPGQLADPASNARTLPGVPEMLDVLEATEGVVTGLLTGNFAETGSLKLRACGIQPGRFHLHVWGDESPSEPPRREDLPGVAMNRYAARLGRRVDSGSVVVVGDTPHDIRCARVHGCRSLAVATGGYSFEQLSTLDADRVVPDLSDTAAIAGWLVGEHGPTDRR